MNNIIIISTPRKKENRDEDLFCVDEDNIDIFCPLQSVDSVSKWRGEGEKRKGEEKRHALSAVCLSICAADRFGCAVCLALTSQGRLFFKLMRL